ncbi:L-tyrosine/L-tryptophan isonitrile synthase family protein [Metapseudomonas furukawaii]|uniref:L-tyrosine/L-tryptophan isonitrile synthase family protein n=1 Tax=Metapseudomonas furukawaii TaxID=1149133 RepID=UPI0040459BF3
MNARQNLEFNRITSKATPRQWKKALAVLDAIYERRCVIDGPNEEHGVIDGWVDPHLVKVLHLVQQNAPIEMVLPAFPGKSPNRKKTLSHLPDLAEQHFIDQLHLLCEEIRAIHSKGAKVHICSDGYVFSDVVNISDKHVRAYTQDISNYCHSRYPGVFSMYDLINTYPSIKCLNTMREELIMQYGVSFFHLKQRIKKEKEFATLYCGITRFLAEDYGGLPTMEHLSKTQIQRIARVAAYRVIQRSEAWGAALSARFPHAVRLSIHPQLRGSNKIGIRLVPGSDMWRTPWHSVAVFRDGTYFLESRSNVDERSNRLVFVSGRPSHYISH